MDARHGTTAAAPGPVGGRPIGEVARLLEVPEATLRSWERRYRVVVPERSRGGQRRYSPRQVEQLRSVLARVAQGLRVGDAFSELEQSRSTPALTRRYGEGAGRLVLVLERSQVAIDLLAPLLAGDGFAVAACTAPGTAEASALEVCPDLTIVELLVDGGGGFALCRRLKEVTGRPVIAVSSLRADDEARRAGADAFVPKPVDPDRLAATIAEVLASQDLA